LTASSRDLLGGFFMKKLIAISSVLALTVAGSGLFAFDILDSEGVKSGFSLDMQAKYKVEIKTEGVDAEGAKLDDNDKTWIEEGDADKQAKVSIGVSYDKDNYAFGVGMKAEKARTDSGIDWGLDDAWGKYYLMDKQFSIRGGSLAGDWQIEDWLQESWMDDKPGVQLAFAPQAVTGLNVGLSLPVPKAKSRTVWDNTTSKDVENTGNWSPTYPLMNMVFGIRLNKTIPNLDLSTELKLNGLKDHNGEDKDNSNEGEGDFKGVDFNFTVRYTFAPVTLTVGLTGGSFASAISPAPDSLLKALARLSFDIPNAEGSSLDLGDPWVQLKMLPNANGTSKESFKDIEVAFEWEPNYSLISETSEGEDGETTTFTKLKALLLFGVKYKLWDSPNTAQEEHPLEFAVQPKLEFKFAPNATLAIYDKVYLVQQAFQQDKGNITTGVKDFVAPADSIKNVVGFSFAWAL
jgi:hypothetical protein